MLIYTVRTSCTTIRGNAKRGSLLGTPKRKVKPLFNTAAFWDDLLGDSSAVTDMPAVSFEKELLHAYPTAKVILTRSDEMA